MAHFFSLTKTLQQPTPKYKLIHCKRAVLIAKGHCCPYIHLSSQKMPEIANTKYLQPCSWKKHSTTLPVVIH
jgi:hypothetical protein